VSGLLPRHHIRNTITGQEVIHQDIRGEVVVGDILLDLKYLHHMSPEAPPGQYSEASFLLNRRSRPENTELEKGGASLALEILRHRLQISASVTGPVLSDGADAGQVQSRKRITENLMLRRLALGQLPHF
jgi:hypothetical protein